MYKAKHIASYCILFPRINPSFSYCNRVSLFSVTHYISVTYKPLPIFQHLYYFAKPILFHCSIIYPYRSHRYLYEHCQNFKPLAMLKSTNNLLFISLLTLTYLLFSFVICLFFLRLLFVNCLSARATRTCLSCYDCLCGSHLPVWIAPSLILVLLALLALWY